MPDDADDPFLSSPRAAAPSPLLARVIEVHGRSADSLWVSSHSSRWDLPLIGREMG